MVRSNFKTNAAFTKATSTPTPPISAEESQVIVLADGTELDSRQTLAAKLRATSDLTQAEIAERTGYSCASSVRRFLCSRTGKQAIRYALIEHLQDAGRVGLSSTIQLAQGCRSETVRQLAAAKLVEWSGIAQELQAEQADNNNRGRELNINISLGGEKSKAPLEVLDQD